MGHEDSQGESGDHLWVEVARNEDVISGTRFFFDRGTNCFLSIPGRSYGLDRHSRATGLTENPVILSMAEPWPWKLSLIVWLVNYIRVSCGHAFYFLPVMQGKSFHANGSPIQRLFHPNLQPIRSSPTTSASYYRPTIYMSDNRFTYMSAGALASRRIIEQSSYTTTPSKSPGDATPSCGEAVYEWKLGEENMKKVDSLLQEQEASGVKKLKAQTDEVPSPERKTTSERSIRRMSTRVRLKTDTSDSRIAAAWVCSPCSDCWQSDSLCFSWRVMIFEASGFRQINST